MIKPEDLKNMEINEGLIGILIAKIDNDIRRYHGWWADHECALLDGELSLEVRNEIAQRYVDVGWNYVYHNTSSENGENPGLTYFYFYIQKPEYEIKNVHHVCKRD